MAKDYYETLGVKKEASKSEIKKAFRNAAKKHHPDKGGDAEQFKKINEAYEVLSDDQKKSQYDRFGSAGPNQGFGGQGGGFGGFGGGAQGVNVDFGDLGDVFSSFFGGAGGFGGFQQQNRPIRGSDFEVEVEISFNESVEGVTRNFRGNSNEKIEVKIPAGIEDRQSLKFRGKGGEGRNGGPKGDLYVHVYVAESAEFQREGLHIISQLEISPFEAMLGKELKVETFWGKETLEIPELTKDQVRISIPGKGITSRGIVGDHLVKIIYKMPKKMTKKLSELLQSAAKESGS